MTEQRNDRNDSRLETLYREAGDVEPEAGLDRMIRARADEAIGTRRSSVRLPWLGGLVTASVAIVAIAVVLQQAPPGGEPVPESPAPREPAEPEAFMAPSLGADAELKSSSDSSSGARLEIPEMQSPGASDAARPAPPAELRAPGQALTGRQRAERMGDIVAEQASSVAEPARSLSEEEGSEEDRSAETTAETGADAPLAALARIETLIGDGEIQRARQAFEAFTRRYPDHPVPEEIETALRNESGKNPN